jgi:hypothetical protein
LSFTIHAPLHLFPALLAVSKAKLAWQLSTSYTYLLPFFFGSCLLQQFSSRGSCLFRPTRGTTSQLLLSFHLSAFASSKFDKRVASQFRSQTPRHSQDSQPCKQSFQLLRLYSRHTGSSLIIHLRTFHPQPSGFTFKLLDRSTLI